MHDEVEESQFRPSRDKLRRLAVKLMVTWEIFPNALLLQDVSVHDSASAGSGAFATVYCGVHDGKMVALKKPHIRPPPAEDGDSDSKTRMIQNFKVRSQCFVAGTAVNLFSVHLPRHSIANRYSTKASNMTTFCHSLESLEMYSRAQFVWSCLG